MLVGCFLWLMLKWIVAKSWTKQELHQESGMSDGVVICTESLLMGKEDADVFWFKCPYPGFQTCLPLLCSGVLGRLLALDKRTDRLLPTEPFCWTWAAFLLEARGSSSSHQQVNHPYHLQGCWDKPWGWRAAGSVPLEGKQNLPPKHVIRHDKT